MSANRLAMPLNMPPPPSTMNKAHISPNTVMTVGISHIPNVIVIIGFPQVGKWSWPSRSVSGIFLSRDSSVRLCMARLRRNEQVCSSSAGVSAMK
jgi:hypothetical protein